MAALRARPEHLSGTSNRPPRRSRIQVAPCATQTKAGEAALLQLGFDNVQACKLSIGTDICSYGVHFAEERMHEVTKLGWKECDVRWHTWRDFDNFQTLWPLMDPLNDLNALQEMLGSLGVDSKDQARLLRLHPDIASLSSGRIGTRFLELRGMGIDSEVIVAALLTAPVLFSWDVTYLTQALQICNALTWTETEPAPLQPSVPQDSFERLCSAFRRFPGRSQCQSFRPYVYRSQYLVPVVVAACHELGIGNLYLKRTQLLTSFLDVASGEDSFSPVKYGAYTPLLRLPQGLQNAADVDRWVSVLSNNVRHVDRVGNGGAMEIMLAYGAVGVMLYKPGDIEAIWRSHASGDGEDCWD